MSDLVICKHRNEYGYTWHRICLHTTAYIHISNTHYDDSRTAVEPVLKTTCVKRPLIQTPPPKKKKQTAFFTNSPVLRDYLFGVALAVHEDRFKCSWLCSRRSTMRSSHARFTLYLSSHYQRFSPAGDQNTRRSVCSILIRMDLKSPPSFWASWMT